MKTSTLLSPFKTAAFGLLILAASCTGPERVTPDSDESALACVGKNLRMTALAIDPAVDFDGDGKVDNDLMKFTPACSRDNTILFEKGGKMSGSEGANVCPSDDESPVSVAPSTWTYNAQTRVLRIVANGDASNVTEWNVLDASATSLKAKLVMESADGDRLDMIMTWQAQ